MSGPHLVLLTSSGSGWQLRVFFRGKVGARSRCHASWYRKRTDACESMRAVTS
jgi:hypothetical protein